MRAGLPLHRSRSARGQIEFINDPLRRQLAEPDGSEREEANEL